MGFLLYLTALLVLVNAAAAARQALIPTPSPAQLRYQDTDFVALIHFNMGTFAHNADPPCDATNWNVKAPYATGETSDPATFNPKLLNTTQWMESITGLGAKHAVLTAKHGCGFTLWPSKAHLPDGSPYNYSVGTPYSAIQRDVLREFVESANAAGIGYGFYYSLMKSFYLCYGFTGKNSCMDRVLPGQHNLSQPDYDAIATEQITELWSQYGNLTEIWIDSVTFSGAAKLLDTLQPQAVSTLGMNPTGWCGTEGGNPSKSVGGGPVWDTGRISRGDYHGDPNSTQWVPKFCDPQLFQEHVWFWEPNLMVRTLAMMIPIYHDIVGRGMVMELAFSIDRDGLVQDTHAVVYKQLGDWVRACYGSPLRTLEHARGAGPFVLQLLHEGDVFDRVQIQEDIALGQRVREYTVEWKHTDTAGPSSGWTTLVGNASAIGTKAIHLFDPVTVPAGGALVRLSVQRAIAAPEIEEFAVFSPCPAHA